MLFTGAQLFVNQVNLPSNAHILNGLQETIDFLDSLELKLINARTSSVGDTRESAAGSAK